MHHHVTLCDETKADLRWWLALLPAWAGTSVLIDPRWLLPAHQLFTDALSEIGYGAYWNGSSFRELAPLADPNPTDVVPPRSHCTQSARRFNIFSGLP